jgi:hypothetical protein
MTLTNAAIALLIVVYLCGRQLKWRAVDPARMWKMPLLLGAVGVVELAKQGTAIHQVDLAILGISAVFAVASGTMMGWIARFRQSPADPRVTESRTGWPGVGIWVALVAVRVGLDVAGHALGSDLAVSTGSILLVLAVNRFANAAVLSARQNRRGYALAGK